MKILIAAVLFFAPLLSFAEGGEFSLEKRLDEEIAKSAANNFDGKMPEGDKLFYSESSKSAFIVFSKNLELRNFGFTLVGKAERAIEEMFGGVEKFKTPIEIHFLPESEADFEGDFLETSRFKFDVVLSVKCSKNLPLDKFYERIANIYLRACAAEFGSKKSHLYWIELALRAMIARQIAEFAPIELARHLKNTGADKMSDVFNYSPKAGGDILKMEASSYFSLLALRSLCGGNSKAWFEMLKYFVLNGTPSGEYLISRFGSDYNDKFFAAVYGEIYARLSGVKDFKASDSDAAYFFTVQKMRKGGPVEIIAGDDIFARRDEIKREISKRITEIKVELPWTNPIYFNVMVAIGRMYDSALEDDENSFKSNMLDAISELKKARSLSQRASGLLK